MDLGGLAAPRARLVVGLLGLADRFACSCRRLRRSCAQGYPGQARCLALPARHPRARSLAAGPGDVALERDPLRAVAGQGRRGRPGDRRAARPRSRRRTTASAGAAGELHRCRRRARARAAGDALGAAAAARRRRRARSRCCASCATHEGRWLAGRRAEWVATWAGVWALGAGGAVDAGEDPALALGRELAEEWSVEPERLAVEALVATPGDMAMLIGQAWLAPGAEVHARPRARRARVVAARPGRVARRVTSATSAHGIVVS